MPNMTDRAPVPPPRAPGAQWKPIETTADLAAIAADWFANPTDLDWGEIHFIMDGIRRVCRR